ncbi:Nif3-like dinuclear metal center hexameric protein [Mycoplasma iguanae]|uniref:GTP cyclohydrolase 1 type 2 homolog n=1 Tax=Mycoplasma iguanae TaxID=292461 RepID=A0ABY5RAD5_9MOLU|nr:Nif3-like dinuclear metal center hexameric protein [Mycoplasma iguanae]UVD81950.1 Nif3-like dinuclear metal center hexameric protein [Mycoplasma iguanae]
MNIINFLNKKYPLENAEKWDPVGFSFHFHDNFKKILVCLDVTEDVLKFAQDNKVDTIISHHPFLFYETLKEEYAKAPYKRKMVKKIKESKINIFAIHTNFDSAKDGTAKQIIKNLKIKPEKIIQLDNYNLMIETKITLDKLILKLEKNNLKNLASNFDLEKDLNQEIKKIAILPGSGGIEAVINAKKFKANLIITSDLKWSDWLVIKSFNKKVIVLEVAHLIESAFINRISEILKKQNDKLEVFNFFENEIKINF